MMIKLEPKGILTIEYFDDEHGNTYSRNSNGFWHRHYGFYEETVSNYQIGELEAAYQNSRLKND